MLGELIHLADYSNPRCEPDGDNDACREKHTPQPKLYGEWHEWAKRMSKTHAQVRCPLCGKWAIWLPKPEAKAKNAEDNKRKREFLKRYRRWCKDTGRPIS